MIRKSVNLLFAVILFHSAMAQVCIPGYSYGTADNDYIDGVELNTITNLGNGPGDGSGYSDYTDLSTSLNIGSSYDITIENTPNYEEGYRIWIDYNQDENFTSDEEIVPAFTLLPGAITTLNFTVPMSANPGETRLRVRCVWGTTLFDACGIQSFGEAEDYTIIINGFDNDLAVIDVQDIFDDCDLSTHEEVSVMINNPGLFSASDFTVSFMVDGGPVFTESYPGSIAAGASSLYTFDAGADLTGDGTHTIMAWTNYAEDLFHGNDSSSVDVNNLFTYLTTGFPSNICYTGGTVFPSPIAGGGTWTGEAVIDATTGELDPTLVGGIGGSTEVTYSFNPSGAYTISEIPYVPQFPIEPTVLGLGDEATANDINIGFPFTYFGNTYTKLFISSNGLIGFNSPSTSYAQQHFPNATDPDNIIALCWTDLNPDGGGTISYELTGVAPNRIFIVYFNEVNHYLAAESVTGQIILHETSNAIDIIADHIESDGGPMTQGIENINGTEGYSAGEMYNNAVWTMDAKAWRYAVTPCSGTVTETISFIEAPVISLADSSICFGETVTLDAGIGAAFYVWSTGETTQTITVNSTDDYWVTYYANESCYVRDTSSIIVHNIPPIELGPNGIACEGTMLDAGNPGAIYAWNTGETTQTLFVTEDGTYTVNVEDPATGCSNTDSIALTIIPLADALFSSIVTDLSVAFTSLAGDVNSWFWDFGDASTSTEENPVHTYTVAGDYNVTFVVTNDCGADMTAEIFSLNTGIHDVHASVINMYPNPANDIIHLEWSDVLSGGNYIIRNALGQQVSEGIMASQIDISNLPAGSYLLQCIHNEFHATKSFVVE